MPQRAGDESRSKRPGVYHRPKEREYGPPPTPLVKGDAAEGLDPALELFWDSAGRLFTDAGLSNPAGLWIIRPTRIWDGSTGVSAGERGVEFERLKFTPGRHEFNVDEGGNIFEHGEPTGRVIVALRSRGAPDPWRQIDAEPVRRPGLGRVAAPRAQAQFRYLDPDDDELDDDAAG